MGEQPVPSRCSGSGPGRLIAMGWTTKYWDIIDGYFWSPSKLGIKSIPNDALERREDYVLVPKQFVNPDGPLYRRICKADEAVERLKRSEEALNDIFDITFAILDDSVIRELLHHAIGIRDEGPIISVGSIDTHFGKRMNNLTQHDGFYVAPESILCVEMKLADDTRRLRHR